MKQKTSFSFQNSQNAVSGCFNGPMSQNLRVIGDNQVFIFYFGYQDEPLIKAEITVGSKDLTPIDTEHESGFEVVIPSGDCILYFSYQGKEFARVQLDVFPAYNSLSIKFCPQKLPLLDRALWWLQGLFLKAEPEQELSEAVLSATERLNGGT